MEQRNTVANGVGLGVVPNPPRTSFMTYVIFKKNESLPCFICGQKTKKSDEGKLIYYLIKTEKIAKRIRKLFGNKSLNLKLFKSSPGHGIHIGACEQHKERLENLHIQILKERKFTKEIVDKIILLN